MSRFLGAISVTSRSPTKIAPASTSSRPASIRSAVVLPDPDGPTRTMNSPSSIWRSSESTAGSSMPGYTRVAWMNRTSAIRKLLSYARLRVGTRAELVERRQRCAEHRRRLRRADLDVRTDLAQLLAHRVELHVPREAAAERDLHVLLRKLQPGQSCAYERDDLERQPLDDLGGDGVVLGGFEDERRQLDDAPARDLAEVHRLGELERRRQPEVRWHRSLEHRLRAAAGLAPRGGVHRRHADVAAAAPVAGDLAERREADLPAVGCDRDAVDARAADDADAPAVVGARPQHRVRVVRDRRAAGPPECGDALVQQDLLRGEVDARHAELSDSRDRSVHPRQLRLGDRPLPQLAQDLDAAVEAEVLR